MKLTSTWGLCAGLLLAGCGGDVASSPSGAGGSGSTGTGTTTGTTTSTTGTTTSTTSSTTTTSTTTTSTTTTSTTTSTTSTTTTTTTTSTTSTTTTGGCGAGCGEFVCCTDRCANLLNDVLNCGQCGNVCPGPQPYCAEGTCGSPPCSAPQICGDAGLCCGQECCTGGTICCEVPGPIEKGPACVAPVDGTCPKGCLGCVCASPDTPIATPSGERPIADLAPGDLVYSVEGDAVVVAPVARVRKNPVAGHRVVRVELASGRVIAISAPHPTADGRTFGDLRAGDRLDGVTIVRAELVPYPHAHTHDILPATSTGAYYAGGALVGSTLR